MVVGVLRPTDVPGVDGAVDEPGRAVVAKKQRFGDVADCRCPAPAMTAYREQQLVLRGGETFARGLLLAPAQEPAQLGAELEQPLVVVVGESPASRHRNIS